MLKNLESGKFKDVRPRTKALVICYFKKVTLFFPFEAIYSLKFKVRTCRMIFIP